MAKILVIDDDKELLEIVKLLLTMHDYAISTIFNAEETLEQINLFEPDLILLDIDLGKHDGRKICKQLKTNIIHKHIPVILVSANAQLEETYSECKACDFITKPFDIFHLMKKIEEHLTVSEELY
jgi:DNA-binding response OmpR family regulator